MSYELCHDLHPSPPNCPNPYDGESPYDWTSTSPYPQTCTYNVREVVSVIAGMASICAWMCVSLPQLWVNYKLKRAESLSVFFLLQWFGGDIANLVGCYLTKQTTGQKWLAMYYVTQDVCLFSQYIYYTKIRKPKPEPGLEYQGDLGRQSYGGAEKPPPAKIDNNLYNKEVSKHKYNYVDDDGDFEDASMKTRQQDTMVLPNGQRLLSTPVRDDDVMESGRSLALSSTGTSTVGLPKQPSLGDLRREREASVCSRGSDITANDRANSYMQSATYMVVKKNRRLSVDGGSLVSSAGSGDDDLMDTPREGQTPTSGGLFVKSVVLLLGVSFVTVSLGGHEAVMGSVAALAPSTTHGSTHSFGDAKMGGMRHLLLFDADGGSNSSSTDGGSSSEKELYYIGIVIGWFSAALYLGSRIPQLVMNFKRGTTDGLSPVMFLMALLGNLTYFLGVILLSPSTDGVLCHLPWIIGSMGTVQFDGIALGQFLYYRKNSNEKLPLDEKSSLFRGPSPRATGSRFGAETTGFLEDAESEVHSVPMVLPANVYAGAIRRGYYGRIGIWYND